MKQRHNLWSQNSENPNAPNNTVVKYKKQTLSKVQEELYRKNLNGRFNKALSELE